MGRRQHIVWDEQGFFYVGQNSAVRKKNKSDIHYGMFIPRVIGPDRYGIAASHYS